MAWHNWITFEDGSGGCIINPPGRDPIFTLDEAKALAEQITGKKATNAQGLPYAAAPVLNRSNDWPAGWGMTLCYSPKECAGRSSCPKRYACSE